MIQALLTSPTFAAFLFRDGFWVALLNPKTALFSCASSSIPAPPRCGKAAA
jgi:hypothetical protein